MPSKLDDFIKIDPNAIPVSNVVKYYNDNFVGDTKFNMPSIDFETISRSFFVFALPKTFDQQAVSGVHLADVDPDSEESLFGIQFLSLIKAYVEELSGRVFQGITPQSRDANRAKYLLFRLLKDLYVKYKSTTDKGKKRELLQQMQEFIRACRGEIVSVQTTGHFGVVSFPVTCNQLLGLIDVEIKAQDTLVANQSIPEMIAETLPKLEQLTHFASDMMLQLAASKPLPSSLAVQIEIFFNDYGPESEEKLRRLLGGEYGHPELSDEEKEAICPYFRVIMSFFNMGYVQSLPAELRLKAFMAFHYKHIQQTTEKLACAIEGSFRKPARDAASHLLSMGDTDLDTQALIALPSTSDDERASLAVILRDVSELVDSQAGSHDLKDSVVGIANRMLSDRRNILAKFNDAAFVVSDEDSNRLLQTNDVATSLYVLQQAHSGRRADIARHILCFQKCYSELMVKVPLLMRVQNILKSGGDQLAPAIPQVQAQLESVIVLLNQMAADIEGLQTVANDLDSQHASLIKDRQNTEWFRGVLPKIRKDISSIKSLTHSVRQTLTDATGQVKSWGAELSQHHIELQNKVMAFQVLGDVLMGNEPNQAALHAMPLVTQFMVQLTRAVQQRNVMALPVPVEARVINQVIKGVGQLTQRLQAAESNRLELEGVRSEQEVFVQRLRAQIEEQEEIIGSLSSVKDENDQLRESAQQAEQRAAAAVERSGVLTQQQREAIAEIADLKEQKKSLVEQLAIVLPQSKFAELPQTQVQVAELAAGRSRERTLQTEVNGLLQTRAENLQEQQSLQVRLDQKRRELAEQQARRVPYSQQNYNRLIQAHCVKAFLRYRDFVRMYGKTYHGAAGINRAARQLIEWKNFANDENNNGSLLEKVLNYISDNSGQKMLGMHKHSFRRILLHELYIAHGFKDKDFFKHTKRSFYLKALRSLDVQDNFPLLQKNYKDGVSGVSSLCEGKVLSKERSNGKDDSNAGEAPLNDLVANGYETSELPIEYGQRQSRQGSGSDLNEDITELSERLATCQASLDRLHHDLDDKNRELRDLAVANGELLQQVQDAIYRPRERLQELQSRQANAGATAEVMSNGRSVTDLGGAGVDGQVPQSLTPANIETKKSNTADVLNLPCSTHGGTWKSKKLREALEMILPDSLFVEVSVSGLDIGLANFYRDMLARVYDNGGKSLSGIETVMLSNEKTLSDCSEAAVESFMTMNSLFHSRASSDFVSIKESLFANFSGDKRLCKAALFLYVVKIINSGEAARLKAEVVDIKQWIEKEIGSKETARIIDTFLTDENCDVLARIPKPTPSVGMVGAGIFGLHGTGSAMRSDADQQGLHASASGASALSPQQ